MKKNTISILLLLMILMNFFSLKTIDLCLGSPGDFKLVSAYWGSMNPIEVKGGEYTTLTILLRYEGRWSFNNLVATLKLPNVIKASYPENKAVVYYKSTISPGTLIQLEYQLYITPQAAKGIYLLTLELEYFVSGYGLTNEILQVPIEITGKPEIAVIALNDTIMEGRQKIILNIKNFGNAEACDLQITRAYSSSITVNSISNTYIKCIMPNETIETILDIYVPSGMRGKNIQISIDTTFTGPKNSIYTKIYNVQLLVNPQEPSTQLDVDIGIRELYIGRMNKVNLKVTNTANSNLKNTKISVSTDVLLKIFGSTTIYVEEIESKQTIEFPMDIYVPQTTSATGTITISISYYDSEKQISRSETRQFTVLLRGLIEIVLTDVTVIPANPRPGSPFSITLTITNIGTSIAYATYAMPILEGLPIQPFGSRSVYVGNVDVNMPTTFTLNLQLLNTTLTQITLPVVLKYMDNLRNISNVTFSITINVARITATTIGEGRSITLITILNPIIIASTIIIISTVIFIFMRRKRK
ncbi:MAG: hypothetical protein NZ926_00640 [Candidatus Methanomethylicia archaeon]|nr:hypothetical protein [Candidatus Methanomethylicia archaeon]MCX8168941.1 hypothetical protein [Candidatus Methanomethylicia archaeon]MDW7988673.1 hypothetical protein [Nitrososphaerota archaeon]